MAWHRVARVVNWNERDVYITDHDKRAELSKAKTQEDELVADVGTTSKKPLFQFKKTLPCTTLKKKKTFGVQLVCPPVFHQGGLGCGCVVVGVCLCVCVCVCFFFWGVFLCVADVGCVSLGRQIQRSSKRSSVLARFVSPLQLQPSCRAEEPRNTDRS